MNRGPIFDLFNPAPEHSIIKVETCLKDDNSALIEGMQYTADFISLEEELSLISMIDSQVWLGDLKRRVQHYGWKYDYRARSLDYNMYLGMLPLWIKALAERLVEQGMMSEEADQVIINEYRPGQGIANHVDCEPCFGDTIVSLSLGSACIMNFVEITSKERRETVLKPRSVVVIQGDARYKWSHGIPSRLADEIDGIRTNRKRRISMTFRKVINRIKKD